MSLVLPNIDGNFAKCDSSLLILTSILTNFRDSLKNTLFSLNLIDFQELDGSAERGPGRGTGKTEK